MGSSMEVPFKIKNRTAIRLSNSTFEYIYPKEMESVSTRDLPTPTFAESITDNSQDRETTPESVDR